MLPTELHRPCSAITRGKGAALGTQRVPKAHAAKRLWPLYISDTRSVCAACSCMKSSFNIYRRCTLFSLMSHARTYVGSHSFERVIWSILYDFFGLLSLCRWVQLITATFTLITDISKQIY